MSRPRRSAVVDLEDVRLARVAQRRFAVPAATMALALETLERAVRRESSLVQILHALSAITAEQALALAETRERGRPAGLKLLRVLGKGASATVYEARGEDGRSY